MPVVAAAVAVVAVLLALLAARSAAVTVFQVCLLIVLTGYAFFGRGFAYLGVSPLYVGELALCMSLVALVAARDRRFGPLHLLLVAFMAWGAVRTLPYVGQYGVDTLRDAVIWGYGLFAIVVSVTLTASRVRRLAGLYRRVIPIFLLWIPVAVVVTTRFKDLIPLTPGSSVSLIDVKAGDMGVHLAAVAAFVLLGLDATRRAGPLRDTRFWGLWVLNLGLVGSLNCAALAAAAAAAASLLFVRSASRWLSAALVGFGLIGLLALANPSVDVGSARAVSFDQLIANATSIFGDQPDSINQATKEWRLKWWNTIISYTVDGPYFWTGKGFGINLADDDGFQVMADGSLRAPHSIEFDILARTGVPGLTIWVGLQLAFALGLLRAAVDARRRGRTFWVQVLGWVFVYWLAALADGSFDVYLEGPQGGIWFWAVFGLGIAAMRLAAADEPEAAASPLATTPTGGRERVDQGGPGIPRTTPKRVGA